MNVVVFPIFFLGFFGLAILGLVFWIMKIVEVAGLPDQQFKAAHTEKLTWILIIVLAGWIGALIWQLAKREEVLAMAGAVSNNPPPGWYADPGAPGLRWWDGTRWTDHRNAPPPGVG
jgi:hypothetical protein